MSDTTAPSAAARRRLATLALLGAVVASLYLAYGRVLAVLLVPHLARVVGTLALAGLAVGATAGARRGHDPAPDATIAGRVAGLGFAAVFCLQMVLEHLRVDQAWSAHGLVTVLVAGVVLAVPFALAGLAAAAALRAGEAEVASAWAATLAGAAVGVGGGLAGLAAMPANVVHVVVGGAACWGALLLAADAGTPMRGPLVAATLVALLAVLGINHDNLRFRWLKTWDTAYTEATAWNATSRVGVFAPTPGATAAQTLPLRRDGAAPPAVPFKWIDVDGAGWMPLLRAGSPADLAFLRDSPAYLAERLRPDGQVLLLGAGAGRDVLAARAAGERRIVVVEPNPVVARLVEDDFGDWSGRPYALPGVELIVGAPRRVLAQLDDRFDVVQLGPPSTGTLPPLLGDDDYLYTRDAFRAAFRRLAPSGLLAVTRYLAPQDPFEVLRVLATARAAWADEGVADPDAHLVVVAQELSAVVLARREPFTPAELAALDGLAAAEGFRIVRDPRRPAPPADDATLLGGPEAAALAAGPFDYAPTTDDRPFFSWVVRSARADVPADPFALLPRAREALAATRLLSLGVAVLVAACVAVGAATLRAAHAPGAALAVHFAALGYGALALVLAALERLALGLGSQVGALVVVAAGIALGGAAGARATRGRRPGAVPVAVALAVVAALLAAVLPAIARALMAARPALAGVLAVLVLVPAGALLGAVLPLAAVRDADADGAPVRAAAAFALEAAGGLLALALVVPVALRLGFTGVFATAAAAFALAAVAGRARVTS